MTEEQTTHAQTLADEAKQLLLHKFVKGQAEHGGDIRDMSPLRLVDEGINEAIDQLVYLLVLREKLTNYNPTDIA